MRGPLHPWHLVVFGGLFLAGCGCGGHNGSDAIKPEVQQTMDDLANLAQQVDGNYDKLTPAQQQKVLTAYGGDEEAARTRFKLIVHPPKAGPVDLTPHPKPKPKGP